MPRKFTINATTGALAFLAAPDYEHTTDAGGNNVYDVIVQASDGNGGTDTQAIAVTVTNGNPGDRNGRRLKQHFLRQRRPRGVFWLGGQRHG